MQTILITSTCGTLCADRWLRCFSRTKDRCRSLRASRTAKASRLESAASSLLTVPSSSTGGGLGGKQAERESEPPERREVNLNCSMLCGRVPWHPFNAHHMHVYPWQLPNMAASHASGTASRSKLPCWVRAGLVGLGGTGVNGKLHKDRDAPLPSIRVSEKET